MSGTAAEGAGGLPPETPAQGVLVGTDPRQPPVTYADLQPGQVANSNSGLINPGQGVGAGTAAGGGYTAGGQRLFTEEDVARIRREEKDKLYGRIDEMDTQLKTLQQEREAREAAIADELRAREEADRKKREEEMDVRSLLETKEHEWSQRFQSLEAERERDRAVLEQERRFNELVNYQRARVDQEAEWIMPELRDLITGNNEAEIDASIELMKARTAQILASVQGAVTSQRQQYRGTAVTAPPSGPMEQQTTFETLTPDDIRSMDMATYTKYRDRLMQSASQARRR